MADHASLSPSSAHRWLVCTQSVVEEAKYPEQPSGSAAVDGTHTHTLVHHCATNDFLDPMMVIGETLEDHEGSFQVDVERAVRANQMINYLKQRKTELGNPKFRFEEKVDPGAWFGHRDIWGTADAQINTDKVFEVCDYKDGFKAVRPQENVQLALYAAGGVYLYLQPGKPLPFETIRLTIIQPRAYKEPQFWETDVGWLLNFIEVVRGVTFDIAEGKTEYAPGDDQCRYCRAKGSCRALTNKALEGVTMGFQNLEIAEQAAEKDPAQMTDDQIREFIEAIPLLKQTIMAVEQAALQRFEAGHPITGLKAVRGRGTRNWKLDEEEMAEKLRRMGIPKASVYVTKLVSPAQTEKLQWEKRDGTKHTLSKRQLETLDKEYIKKGQGKITIVPSSDEREEVHLGAAQMFGSVDQPEEMPEWLT